MMKEELDRIDSLLTQRYPRPPSRHVHFLVEEQPPVSIKETLKKLTMQSPYPSTAQALANPHPPLKRKQSFAHRPQTVAGTKNHNNDAYPSIAQGLKTINELK